MKSGILSLATLATCSRCSRMWSSIVRPRSAAAHRRGASRGPRPLRAQPAPSAAGSRPGDRDLVAGRAGTDKGEARRAAKGRGRRAGGGGWQARAAALAKQRRPARRAAGVRCNKQLATQTPARWACAAAAGRAGTCSRARLGRRRLLMSVSGRPCEGPVRCPASAGVRVPAGPPGRRRAELRAPRASLNLRASSHSELGTVLS